MIALILMLRSLLASIRYAWREESFRGALLAAAILVGLGTITYSVSQHWNVVNGFYFAVCTLTTSTVADPHLTLTGLPIKVFTALYVLIGIGLLVEVMRQIGFGYVAMRADVASKLRHHEPPAGAD